MQICVARMLQESGIFFGVCTSSHFLAVCSADLDDMQLLALLGIGFLQGLYALDAADGSADQPHEIINLLIQALLQ